MKSILKRRSFGQNGFEVTEIGFGAMNLRALPDHETVEKLIGDVLDAGVTLIDTARGYNTMEWPGAHNDTNVYIESEVMLGKVISKRTSADEPITIITKGHGYTPDEFQRHLSESLERLQIEKQGEKLFIGAQEIRLCYLLHGIKYDRWDGIVDSGVLQYAEQLRGQGVFHFLGFSSHYGDVDVIKTAIESGVFQLCELPYNVYNPSLGEEGEQDLIKLAYDRGMAVVNMKAFNGNGTADIFAQLSGITGITHSDMARFCLSNPYISTIDAGIRFISELKTDIEASEMPMLGSEERLEMRERAKKISPHLDAICRECMHCLEKFECSQVVNFPGILGIHARYKISKSLGLQTNEYLLEYSDLPDGQKNCIGCGECNPWCEYHLDIPNLLDQAARDLG